MAPPPASDIRPAAVPHAAKPAPWRAGAHRLGRALDWIETHPAGAWTLFVLLVWMIVGWEATSWWRHDFPGAWFHDKSAHRYDDLGVVMARAREATADDLRAYWFGAQIDHVGWYRPIPSTLWVLQSRWFGDEDRRWNLVSLALYFLMVPALGWLAASLWTGPRWQRMAVGLGAAALFGGPGLASSTLHFWMLTWWPAQPDLLSLLFGSLLLGATAHYVRTGRRGWAYAAPVLFLLGVLCKETAYVAGIGATLLLARHRRCWPLLALLALEGIALFLYRAWALEGFQAGRWTPSPRLVTSTLSGLQMQWDLTLHHLQAHLLPLATAACAGLAMRRRWPPAGWIGVSLAIYLVLCVLLLGSLSDSPFVQAWEVFGATAAGTLLVIGLGRLGRRWPFPEIIVTVALVWVIAENYPPVYAWYRIWAVALVRAVAALVIAALVHWIAERRRAPRGQRVDAAATT